MEFNWELCADLHNEIIRRGWEATGQDWSSAPFRSFWETYPDKHQILSEIADPMVISFWKKALTLPDADHDESYHYFFYYIHGLAFPDDSLNQGCLEILNSDSSDGNRYIMLYQSASLESHPAGIILDQELGKVIMQMSLWSSDWDDLRLQWQPLENLLRQYLDMNDTRKVIAQNFRLPGNMPEHMPDVHDPWLVQSYSSEILARTLGAYEKLIKAIEDRMPPSNETENAGYLAEDGTLNENDVRQGAFARAFLTSAHKPRKSKLRFIAPGIELPSEDRLYHQPFHNIRRPRPYYGPPGEEPLEEDPAPYIPLLLFPAANNQAGSSEGFTWPFDELNNVPSGIWLEPVDPFIWHDHEDATTLRLPFEIGGGSPSYAQYNDGARFEEPSKTSLYQSHFNPFITGHRTQLFLILENWVNMVESGHWQVDASGVTGGIEKFAEADNSVDKALLYTVPLHW